MICSVKKSLLILSLFCSTSTFSQIDRFVGFETFDYNGANWSILVIDGAYSLNSTSISNDFISADFIDSDLKDLTSANHNDKANLAGFDLAFSAVFSQKKEEFLGMADAGYFIGIKARDHFDLSYSKDIFDLMFYGNKMFLGETVELKSSGNRLKYEQFQIGAFKAFTSDKKTITVGAGVSFVKGTNGFSFNLNEGTTLYMEDNAEYIDLALDGSYNITDQTKIGLGSLNGIGVSSDFFVVVDYENGDNASLKISDLGVISWNNLSATYTSDDEFHFEGIAIENLLTFNDSLMPEISKSSIVSETSITEVNQSFKSNLPVRIQVKGTKVLADKKIYTTIGIRHQLNSNYTPYYYLKGKFKMSEKFMAGLKLAYGGYGKFNTGIELSTVIIKQTLIVLGSSNIDALIAPSSFNGQSYYLSLQKMF